MAKSLEEIGSILNARTTSGSMKALTTQALDATVVNARRRFRRVLSVWATDLLALSAQGTRPIRWIGDDLTSDE